MIDNLVVAFSNIFFLFPFCLSIQYNDYITAFCVGILTMASFTSHLVECHKHFMSGMSYFSEKISVQLNWFDRFGVALVALRFIIMIFTFSLDNVYLLPFYYLNSEIMIIIITLFVGGLSQYQLPREYKWKHYIPLHCLWHILVARQMYYVLLILYL